MIRARAGRADSRRPRPSVLVFAIVATLALVAACSGGESAGPTNGGATPSSSPTGPAASGSDLPTDPATGSPSPTETAGGTPTEPPPSSTPAPSADCSGSDQNRAFFGQAAISMSWPVYCAVLPDGWFLETGAYRLADGGHLEVTYRGPGDAHLAIVEGNICAGTDVEVCAPRDAVIGPAAFGDRDGELGRLANGLVLDVDRGATPSWRATGVGLGEEAFRTIGAALLVVDG